MLDVEIHGYADNVTIARLLLRKLTSAIRPHRARGDRQVDREAGR